MTQRWYDYGDFEETETGFSLASGDRVWTLVTPMFSYMQGTTQDHLWLMSDGGNRGWNYAMDRMEGSTPVWGSLREALEFLRSGVRLPGGTERWHPITVGDAWRRSEGKPLRRAASRAADRALRAWEDKEKK